MRPVAVLPARNDDLIRKALRLAADLTDACARDDMVTLRALLTEPEPVVEDVPEHAHHLIVRAACARLDARPEDVYAGRRTKNTVLARHVAGYVMRRLGASLPEIARLYGCHHTSVMHGIRRVTNEPDLLDVALTVMEEVGAPRILDSVPA